MKSTGQNYLLGASLAVATLFNSFSASAETDMTKVKCGDFSQIMQSKDPQMEVAGSLFMGFLWGLYKDQDEPMVIGNASDIEKLKKLATFCTANPNANLMTAADKVMGQD